MVSDNLQQNHTMFIIIITYYP